MVSDIDVYKARVAPGDSVCFSFKGGRISGRVLSLGQKRALVCSDRGDDYRVPYHRLQPLAPVTDYSAVERRALDRCRDLMQQHGLQRAGWVAKLDDCRSRAGACYFTKKSIVLSRLYVRAASPAELDDTILHEIAHALVGPQHHHDSVWRAQARAIGCSGNRCHAVPFSPPRWIAACSSGCFRRSMHRRRRGVVCRRCGAPITWRRWDGKLDAPHRHPRGSDASASQRLSGPAALRQQRMPVQGEFDFGGA